jgi:CRP-like cAMP-binding protein
MRSDELRRRFPALLKHFSEADAAALGAALTPQHFETGETLTAYREPADTLHLITGGSVAIHVMQEGENLVLGQAVPGCVVGEVGLVEPGPASATLEAREPVDTLALPHERFEKLCREEPSVASSLLRAISSELVARLRNSGHDILRRVDDHAWMRLRAREDRPGWLARIAALVRGAEGGDA